jgi:hypothetical protein
VDDFQRKPVGLGSGGGLHVWQSIRLGWGLLAILILKEYAWDAKVEVIMLYKQMTAFVALLVCLPLLADDVSDRAKLLGSWQRQDDSGKEVAVWVLEMKGDALHITVSVGGQKVSEIECAPKGAECEGAVKGVKTSVRMYYDGPALVQFETRGEDVTKRRLVVTGQPEMMEIEVMPIVGTDKAETMHLKRIKPSESR